MTERGTKGGCRVSDPVPEAVVSEGYCSLLLTTLSDMLARKRLKQLVELLLDHYISFRRIVIECGQKISVSSVARLPFPEHSSSP